MKKKTLLSTLLLATVFATNSNAQGLVTDTLFGTNGQVTSLPVGVTETQKILQQPDKKTILCGYNYDFNCNCYYNNMMRVDACGSLDSSFGTNGSVHHTFDQRNSGYDYVLQPDGKILVSGVQSDGNSGSQQFPFIARYNSDGSVDSTFGTNGTNKINYLGPGNLTAIYLMDSGRILCTGSPNGNANLIMRFDSTGAVDNTYGTNGLVQHAVPPGVNFFYDFQSVMRSDGKIVSAAPGYLGVNNDKNVVLSCFDTLGVIDSTFGTNGFYIDYNFVIGNGLRLALQNDDKLIVAQHNYAETAIIVARYNTNGSIDSTYGVNGYIIETGTRLKFLSIFNDDKILIGYEGFGLLKFKKYDTNGVEDTSFSLNGGNTFQFPNTDLARRAIASSNDELLMGGSGSAYSMTRFVLGSTVPHITQNVFTLNANVAAAGVTYQWYLNGTAINGATDSIYTCTQSGTYLVEVTNIWGCASSDFVTVTNTGIATQNGIDGFSFYPNPVHETLTVEMKSPGINADYFISDAVGRIVLTGKTTAEKTTIDMHMLSSGINFLKLTSAHGNSIVKVVKD